MITKKKPLHHITPWLSATDLWRLHLRCIPRRRRRRSILTNKYGAVGRPNELRKCTTIRFAMHRTTTTTARTTTTKTHGGAWRACRRRSPINFQYIRVTTDPADGKYVCALPMLCFFVFVFAFNDVAHPSARSQ